MRSSKRLLLPAALALALAACGGQTPQATAPALPAGFATFKVEAGNDMPGHSWDGVVEAVRRADLAAQTSGRVLEVRVDVNQAVHAGDVLLRISNVEQEAGANSARAQLRAAEANAAEAELNYKRIAALADGQFVSKAQIDQARAARDAAFAARDAARAQLAQASQQAAYTVVKAPFAGIVSARDVEPGETVAPGQPLLSLYAPRELRLEVMVPQSRADAIRRDPRAQVVLAGGRSVEAAEVTVFPAADPASHSVNVRVRLPEALEPAPAPGTTAKVLFEADRNEPVIGTAQPIRIPQSALVQRGELSAVYVKQDGTLLLRQVRIGGRVGDAIEIISGLRPGEQVVKDPVAAMQALAAQRKAAEGGHG